MALTDEQLWAFVLSPQIEVEDLALAAKAAHAAATDFIGRRRQPGQRQTITFELRYDPISGGW